MQIMQKNMDWRNGKNMQHKEKKNIRTNVKKKPQDDSQVH